MKNLKNTSNAKTAHLDALSHEIAVEEAARVVSLQRLNEIPTCSERLYMALPEQCRLNELHEDAFRLVLRANKRLYRLHMKAAKFAAEWALLSEKAQIVK